MCSWCSLPDIKSCLQKGAALIFLEVTEIFVIEVAKWHDCILILLLGKECVCYNQFMIILADLLGAYRGQGG